MLFQLDADDSKQDIKRRQQERRRKELDEDIETAREDLKKIKLDGAGVSPLNRQ